MSIPDDFNFLEEKPLESQEDLSNSKFGHEEIAATLQQIIKKSPSPFTIGLFAKWGSGKSTVANSLKKRLPQNNIPVIIFDVWKHEGDALRRTFLKEMVCQLKKFGSDFFDTDFKINDRIEQSISRDSESKIVFNKELFDQIQPFVVLGIVALVWIGHVAYIHNKMTLFWSFLTPIIGTGTGVGLLFWLVKNSVNLFSKETVTHGVDKFEDPHEFEEEFSSILSSLKHPRILIVFDNLDRVTEDKVSEILSTIKTFLEPRDIADNKKEVVFLIPCDARAIKEHLINIYNSSGTSSFDPDEFLRKFFNTIIWIPDFIPSELESFAHTSLKKTKIKLLDDNNVAWIIIKAFRDNPRQIVQFINILLANYLLVAEREGDGKDFADGFLKDNVPQLTKYLVLNQLFPEEMEILRAKKILNLQEVKKEDIKKSDGKTTTVGVDAFIRFVEETRNIPIENLKVFFTLRRSAQEKGFSGFDSFVAYLEDRKTEDAKKYCSQIGDLSNSEVADAFSQSIKSEMENKNNPVSLANLIHTLFEVVADGGISLSSTVYAEINNLFKGKIKNEVSSISPRLMDTVFLSKYPAYRKTVISEWVKTFRDQITNTQKVNPRPFMDEIFNIFAEHPDYLDQTNANELEQFLVSHLSTDLEILQIINKNKDLQEKLFSEPYIDGFVQSLPAGGTAADLEARISALSDVDDAILSSGDADQLLGKLAQIQTTENQATGNPIQDKNKIVTSYRKIINQHLAWIGSAQATAKDTFIDTLLAGFNTIPNHDDRVNFIPIMLEAKSYASEAKSREIDANINGFIGSASPSAFGSLISSLPQELKDIFFGVEAYYPPGEARAFHDHSFRKEWFEKIPSKQKQSFLPRFFNQNNPDALALIESLDPKDDPVVSKYVESLSNEIKDGATEFAPFLVLMKGLGIRRFTASAIQSILLKTYGRVGNPLKQELLDIIVGHKKEFSSDSWKEFENILLAVIEQGPMSEAISVFGNIPTKINKLNFEINKLVASACARINKTSHPEMEQFLNILTHSAVEAELGGKNIQKIMECSVESMKSGDTAKREYIKSKLIDFIQRAENKMGLLKKIIEVIEIGPLSESTAILSPIHGMSDFWSSYPGIKKEFADELRLGAKRASDKEFQDFMKKSASELDPEPEKKSKSKE